MYAKISNGAVEQFPYSLSDLRRDNPNTSFPQNPENSLLQSWDVFEVTQLSEPNDDPNANHINPNDAPHLENGQWVLGWTVTAKTAAEVQQATDEEAARNRAERDDLLAKTDFYALSDVTMTDAMAAYRQALRDITSHANWPYLDAGDWPTKP